MEETSSPQPIGTLPRLMGPMALLKYAWGTFKQHWKTLVGIQIIPVLLTIVAVALGFLGSKGGDATHTPALGASAGILALIVIIIVVIATLWSTVALLVAVRDSAENISVQEAFKRSKGKIGAYFWISLISGFITLGGTILLIVPGIIFAGWFALSSYAFIVEGDRGLNALLKSKEYVRGYWAAVFGRIIFIGIVAWLINFIVQLIAGLLHQPVISSIVSGVLELVLVPLALLYGYRLYSNLREVKGQVTASSKGKGWFIGIGIFGLVAIPLIIIALISAAIFSVAHTTNKINLDTQFQTNLQRALQNPK